MKIKSIYAYSKKLFLTKPYSIAYKTIKDIEVVFLEIELENGLIGIGAANPCPEVVNETSEEALSNLQSDFISKLVGKDIGCFIHYINQTAIHFPNKPGTLAALDIALHDLFCKMLGISVLDFYGKKQKALPTSITIGIKGKQEMLDEAIEYYKLGFRILKIKLGKDVDLDIERLKILSDKFGKKIKIRVDANQGYSLENCKHFLNSTRQLGLELIEQPLKVGRDYSLVEISQADRKLLVADESLLSPSTAWSLSNPPQPYGVYNIKLMKTGGIIGAKSIATIAQSAGIDLFWGCNDESIVSITAALYAAYSCSNTKYLDLDGSFDLAKDLVEGGFELKDGYLFPKNLPGLGFEKIEINNKF